MRVWTACCFAVKVTSSSKRLRPADLGPNPPADGNPSIPLSFPLKTRAKHAHFLPLFPPISAENSRKFSPLESGGFPDDVHLEQVPTDPAVPSPRKSILSAIKSWKSIESWFWVYFGVCFAGLILWSGSISDVFLAEQVQLEATRE